MSLQAIQWAWGQSLPATQKLVLVAMADHATKEEGICWPSLRLLSEKTGLCDRTIKQARRALREKNLIIALKPGRYQLCHNLPQEGSAQMLGKISGENPAPAQREREARSPRENVQKNLPKASDSRLGESDARAEESPAPPYKNLLKNPKRTGLSESRLNQLSLREAHLFQTWQRHCQDGFCELAKSRKTHPAEAKQALLSLMRSIAPSLLPLLEEEEG